MLNRSLTLLILVILLSMSKKVYAQYGSNENVYMYFYDFKDSSKDYTELIDISNKLSRKVKYYYIVSRELDINIKLIWRIQGNYNNMMYRFKIPEDFYVDSVNQMALTQCFDDVLNPFEMDISKPQTEFNQVLKYDTLPVNLITLKTDETFDSKDNYGNSGIIIKDNPAPRKILIKGYFVDRKLVVINGLFFFEDVQKVIKDSIFSETLKLKGKKGFKKKLDLYLQLLAFRGINYQLTKSGNAIEMSFPQYQFTVKIDKTNIDRYLQGLVHGGNILQTIAPLR